MDITFNKRNSIIEVERLIRRGYDKCYVTHLGIFPYGSRTLKDTLVSDPHEVVLTSELLEGLKSDNNSFSIGEFKWK